MACLMAGSTTGTTGWVARYDAVFKFFDQNQVSNRANHPLVVDDCQGISHAIVSGDSPLNDNLQQEGEVTMKVVTLMENTTCREDLACEHGLSLYIETGDTRLLFDAGQSGAFADNARKLGVKLENVDLAVLSHGHYDHGGGLKRFLEINDHAPVYVNCHAFEPHYHGKRYIGLAPELEKESRLRKADGIYEIGPGLSLHTLPGMPTDWAGLTVLEEGRLIPEDFRHEQYLMVEEKGRRILISGCSHKGILQIMAHFQPDVLIGGFHFMKVEDKAVLQEAAKTLMKYPTVYYTGHCTGETQFAVMKEILGGRLQYLAAGSTVLL